MRAFGFLLRFYSYVFHLSLSGFLFIIAILARDADQHLHLAMLPFPEEKMISRVTMLSLAGSISVILALMKIFRLMFPLWALATVGLAISGFVFSDFKFNGVHGLLWALLFIAAALAAFIGAVWTLNPPRKRSYF